MFKAYVFVYINNKKYLRDVEQMLNWIDCVEPHALGKTIRPKVSSISLKSFVKTGGKNNL